MLRSSLRGALRSPELTRWYLTPRPRFIATGQGGA